MHAMTISNACGDVSNAGDDDQASCFRQLASTTFTNNMCEATFSMLPPRDDPNQLLAESWQLTQQPSHAGEKHDQEDVELDDSQAIHYRALMARGLSVLQARPDIGCAVNQLSRGMAKHTVGDWEGPKRLGLYFVDKQEV